MIDLCFVIIFKNKEIAKIEVDIDYLIEHLIKPQSMDSISY